MAAPNQWKPSFFSTVGKRVQVILARPFRSETVEVNSSHWVHPFTPSIFRRGIYRYHIKALVACHVVQEGLTLHPGEVDLHPLASDPGNHAIGAVLLLGTWEATLLLVIVCYLHGAT